MVAFEIFRTKGASELDVAGDERSVCGKQWRNFARRNPNVKIAESDRNVAPIEENFSGSMEMLLEGAIVGGDCRVLVFARLARDNCRGGSVAAIGDSGVSWACIGLATRSTS